MAGTPSATSRLVLRPHLPTSQMGCPGELGASGRTWVSPLHPDVCSRVLQEGLGHSLCHRRAQGLSPPWGVGRGARLRPSVGREPRRGAHLGAGRHGDVQVAEDVLRVLILHCLAQEGQGPCWLPTAVPHLDSATQNGGSGAALTPPSPATSPASSGLSASPILATRPASSEDTPFPDPSHQPGQLWALCLPNF